MTDQIKLQVKKESIMKRKLFILCFCVFSIFLFNAFADEVEDKLAILKLVDQQFEAFNKHDAEAVALPAAENYENWDYSVKNKAAKIQTISRLFKEHPNIQGKRIKYRIIFVTPDVAIYKDIAEFFNMVDKNGKTLPPDYELWAGVWVKKNGKWVEVASFCKEIKKEDIEKSLNCSSD